MAEYRKRGPSAYSTADFTSVRGTLLSRPLRTSVRVTLRTGPVPWKVPRARSGSRPGNKPMSTETTPDGSTSTEYQVVCGSHGIVQDGIADWIAAEIVRDEHREDCPAERIEWVDSEPFRKASSLDRTSTAADQIEERNQDRHGGRENHCPNCGTFITTDRPTKCDDCGVTVRESNDGEGDMVTLS